MTFLRCDIKDDDHDAYLNMVEELNQHLKNIMNDDELSLRLVKQAHLELEASMTFTMAASYLSSGGFHGFANFFFKLSNVTMKLVFTIGTMTDLSMMKPIQHPDWKREINLRNLSEKSLVLSRFEFPTQYSLLHTRKDYAGNSKLDSTKYILGRFLRMISV